MSDTTSPTRKNIEENIIARSTNEKKFKEKILEKICCILDASSLAPHVRNHLKLSLKDLLEKGIAAYSQDDYDGEEDMIHTLILHREKPFATELDKYKAELTPAEYGNLLMLADSYVLADLDWANLYSYCTKLFPIISKLKRRLLLKRRGTDMTNCRYVINKSHIAQIQKESLEAAEATGNYALITDEACACAISVLVNKTTGSNQFKNTIAPHLNYTDTETEKAKSHSPDIHTIFQLAYGLRLSAEDFDSFVDSSLNICRNPFDREQAIYLFGMHTGISFKRATELIGQYEKSGYTPEEITLSHKEADKKIFAFFKDNPVTDLNHEPDDQPLDDALAAKFFELLASIGTTDTETAEKQLAKERLIIAQREIREIEDLLIPQTVAAIKQAYKNAGTALEHNRTNLIAEMERILDIFLVQETVTLDNLPYHTDSDAIITYLINEVERFAAADTSFKSNNLSSAGKGALMSFLTDQRYAVRRKKMEDLFTTNRINQVKQGNAKKIDRAFMMRLVYLRALIAKLTGQTDAGGAVRMFREKGTDLMQECAYPAPNYLFPHDIAIFLALSDTTAFSPLIYQMFFPRKKEIEDKNP